MTAEKTIHAFTKHGAERIRQTIKTVDGLPHQFRSGRKPVRYVESFAAYGPTVDEPLKAFCTTGLWFMDGVAYYNTTEEDLSVTVEGGTEDDPHILYARLCNDIISLVEYAADEELPETVEGEEAFYFPIGEVWLSEDEDVALTRRTWVGGDIVFTAAASESADFPFKFKQTGPTGGTLVLGYVYVNGVAVTITEYPSGGVLSGITTSIKYWLSVAESGGAIVVTWVAGTSFPASTATTEIYRMLDITCAADVITTWIQCQLGDIHITRSMQDIQYVAAPLYQLQKKVNGAWVVITGGQHEVET
jgi:hypothetical protein